VKLINNEIAENQHEKIPMHENDETCVRLFWFTIDS